MRQPRLEQIKNGWAALGEGWAVHGSTQEEALELFRQAQRWHTDIEQRMLPERQHLSS